MQNAYLEVIREFVNVLQNVQMILNLAQSAQVMEILTTTNVNSTGLLAYDKDLCKLNTKDLVVSIS